MSLPNERELNRLLDRVKAEIFKDRYNSAFLGSLMFSQKFQWNKEIPTICWDGETIHWNPHFFLSLPEETRLTCLLHELWHIARLFFLRQGDRDLELWNYACDIRINNDLINEGRSFRGIEDAWKDPTIDQGPEGVLSEEQIYDLLVQGLIPLPPLPGSGGTGAFGKLNEGGDIRPNPKVSKTPTEMLKDVVRAVQQAEIAGQAGNLPGSVKKILNDFLTPKIPWRSVLMQFFTDIMDEDYSWKRPNRRYPDIYLPSIGNYDEGRLEHIAFIEDTSGSITPQFHKRMNSEIKYIQEVLRPKKLTLVQFDTQIQQERVFTEDEPFEQIEIRGFGGTDLRCVRQWLIENRPTAAVIFSDLQCSPMEKIFPEIPLIWVVVNNRSAWVNQGKLIYITEN